MREIAKAVQPPSSVSELPGQRRPRRGRHEPPRRGRRADPAPCRSNGSTHRHVAGRTRAIARSAAGLGRPSRASEHERAAAVPQPVRHLVEAGHQPAGPARQPDQVEAAARQHRLRPGPTRSGGALTGARAALANWLRARRGPDAPRSALTHMPAARQPRRQIGDQRRRPARPRSGSCVSAGRGVARRDAATRARPRPPSSTSTSSTRLLSRCRCVGLPRSSLLGRRLAPRSSPAGPARP